MADEKVVDLGLGMDDFINSGSTETQESKASPETEESEKEAETSPESEIQKESKDTVEKTDAVTDKTEEVKTSDAEQSEDENDKASKPSIDFEPERQSLKKQIEDNRVWGREQNEKAVVLQQEVNKLKAQADGTYDEEAEASPSPEQIKLNADLQGRVDASRTMIVDKLGEEYVRDTIDAKDSDWQKLVLANPLNALRAKASKTPYLEIQKIIEEEKFFTDYGRNPESIKTKIKEELGKELRAEITKEFKDKIKTKEKLPKDLSDVKGEKQTSEEDKKFKPTPLGDVFSLQ